jgi:hypothetical protein
MQLELLQAPPDLVTSESWLTVSGFPRYEVSSLGRFRNKATGQYLGGSTVHNGYLHIGLIRDGRQITKLAHRLVAETFLVKPSPLHNDVNHQNKVRTDNRVQNLEWMTRSANSKHAKSRRE